MIIFLLSSVENIVGKGENAGYQHFLLFPQCFLKAFSSGWLKVGIVWERVQEEVIVCKGKKYKLSRQHKILCFNNLEKKINIILETLWEKEKMYVASNFFFHPKVLQKPNIFPRGP